VHAQAILVKQVNCLIRQVCEDQKATAFSVSNKLGMSQNTWGEITVRNTRMQQDAQLESLGCCFHPKDKSTWSWKVPNYAQLSGLGPSEVDGGWFWLLGFNDRQIFLASDTEDDIFKIRVVDTVPAYIIEKFMYLVLEDICTQRLAS
jgi:hypothetical protein